ncbi:TetR/AcrR family transcriptional regulator [Rummeliibacillus pycnus]|uniref:TetR/AcrR family transcriptional regulator n=1 Tax=Rummeliibacillus pycnus TaxID=101070 RepID=UPI000C9C1149|nr:TetR/AcrR family transcriptional regulator [Rummeliibacillus pycnus]
MATRKKIDFNIVLQKSINLIDENGLDELSLSSLAKELQIRPPSLYNHINSLSELKQALAIQGLKELYQYMLHAAIGKSGDDAIRNLSYAYVQFVRTHPGLYDTTTRFPNPEDPELQHQQQLIVELVMQVLEAYGLQKEMSIHMVRGFRSILHGFTSIEQTGGFGMPLDTDQSLSLLIDTFIRGIHSITNYSSDNRKRL